MTQSSRRNFLKAVSLAGAAGMMAPLSAQAAKAIKVAKWDETVDVIVVGAGGAGPFAALEAKNNGANVLVLEKNPTVYVSTSAVNGGGITAAETKAQKAAKQIDSKENFYKEMIQAGGGRNDPMLIKLFVDNAADTVDWFYDRGMKFFFRGYPGFSLDRQHSNMSAKGREYIDMLMKEINAKKVPIRTMNRVERLVCNPETGRVEGVKLNARGKTQFIRATKGVILASGGFAGSAEMVDRFLIPFKGSICSAAPSSTGDGMLMAQQIGATNTHMGYGAVYAYGLVTDQKKRRGLIHRGYDMAAVYGGVIVNKLGKRFVKEESTPTGVALKEVEQPDSTLWVIDDAKMFDGYLHMKMPGVIGWTHERVQQEAKEQKYFITTADTIEELCKKTGIDAAGLKATIEAHNKYVDMGKDPEFDRKNIKVKFGKGPYAALRGQPIALASTGGLKVDKELRVLDAYLEPIPGLYAAGEIIGGLHGAQYLGSCGFSSALTFGRLSGRNAAKAKA